MQDNIEFDAIVAKKIDWKTDYEIYMPGQIGTWFQENKPIPKLVNGISISLLIKEKKTIKTQNYNLVPDPETHAGDYIQKIYNSCKTSIEKEDYHLTSTHLHKIKNSDNNYQYEILLYIRLSSITDIGMDPNNELYSYQNYAIQQEIIKDKIVNLNLTKAHNSDFVKEIINNNLKSIDVSKISVARQGKLLEENKSTYLQVKESYGFMKPALISEKAETDLLLPKKEEFIPVPESNIYDFKRRSECSIVLNEQQLRTLKFSKQQQNPSDEVPTSAGNCSCNIV